MRTALNIFAVMLVFFGAVWIGQAWRLLPGGVMVGKSQWALYGAGAIGLGAIVALLANRRRKGS